MLNLIGLELKRYNLKPYNIAAAVSAVVMLGFIYLIAFIPVIEPSDSDSALFESLRFVTGLMIIVTMGIFSILSAVMAARFIVSEYGEKRATLLFSYPVAREKVFSAKSILVTGYTVVSMLLCGMAVLLIFVLSDLIFKFSVEKPTFEMILYSIINLAICAVVAGGCGMISLWFGFIKKSVITTIVAACIIIVIICQVVSMSLFSSLALYVILAVVGIAAAISYLSVRRQVKMMEV